MAPPESVSDDAASRVRNMLRFIQTPPFNRCLASFALHLPHMRPLRDDPAHPDGRRTHRLILDGGRIAMRVAPAAENRKIAEDSSARGRTARREDGVSSEP